MKLSRNEKPITMSEAAIVNETSKKWRNWCTNGVSASIKSTCDEETEASNDAVRNMDRQSQLPENGSTVYKSRQTDTKIRPCWHGGIERSCSLVWRYRRAWHQRRGAVCIADCDAEVVKSVMYENTVIETASQRKSETIGPHIGIAANDWPVANGPWHRNDGGEASAKLILTSRCADDVPERLNK
jgi:hypothetical protein